MNRITIDQVVYTGGDQNSEVGFAEHGQITATYHSTIEWDIQNGMEDFYVVWGCGQSGNSVPIFQYDDETKMLLLTNAHFDENGDMTIIDWLNDQTSWSNFSFTKEKVYSISQGRDLPTSYVGYPMSFLVDGSQIGLGEAGTRVEEAGVTALVLPFPVFNKYDNEAVKKYVEEGDDSGSIVEKPPYTYWKFDIDNVTGICHLTITCHNGNPVAAFTHMINIGSDLVANLGDQLFYGEGNVDTFLDLSLIKDFGGYNKNLKLNSMFESKKIMENLVIEFAQMGVGRVRQQQPPNYVEFIQRNVDENSTPRHRG